MENREEFRPAMQQDTDPAMQQDDQQG